jgi:hypothetical protein
MKLNNAKDRGKCHKSRIQESEERMKRLSTAFN